MSFISGKGLRHTGQLITLHRRHNDHDGVSNHQPYGCLLNRLFGRRSKKTSKLCVTGLCAGNSPGPVNSPHKGPVTRTRQIWGIWQLRLESPETPNLGQNQWCFVPCDLEIWRMTFENDRASLLCCFKLCATFHSHWWIQTGVTVRNAHFGSNSTIFRAVWPWNLTDDLEKQ